MKTDENEPEGTQQKICSKVVKVFTFEIASRT
jgi:hypothetical protein